VEIPTWVTILGMSIAFGFGVGVSWALANSRIKAAAVKVAALEKWKDSHVDIDPRLSQLEEWRREYREEAGAALGELGALQQEVALLRNILVGVSGRNGVVGDLRTTAERLAKMDSQLPEWLREARHWKVNEFQRIADTLQLRMLELEEAMRHLGHDVTPPRRSGNG
jgi:hypothetical protein